MLIHTSTKVMKALNELVSCPYWLHPKLPFWLKLLPPPEVSCASVLLSQAASPHFLPTATLLTASVRLLVAVVTQQLVISASWLQAAVICLSGALKVEMSFSPFYFQPCSDSFLFTSPSVAFFHISPLMFLCCFTRDYLKPHAVLGGHWRSQKWLRIE